jgi:hypothetical protein
LTQHPLKQRLLKEAALFTGLLFVGLVLMPIGIYWVGQNVFGEYGGQGYSAFFGTLSTKIRGREFVSWFFVLSPYLAWQLLRLTNFAWRHLNRADSRSGSIRQ